MLVERRKTAFYTMFLGILFMLSAQVVVGQGDQVSMTRPRRVSKATSVRTIPSGQQAKLIGNVTRVGEDTFSVCDMEGAETVVQLTDSTKVETHRRGVFRGGTVRGKSALLVGLSVTVKGRGNEAGGLVAKWVKFHDSAHRAATEVETRAIPLEREQDRIAGQLDETTIVATNAWKDAKTAQESADKAQNSADQAQNTADAAKTDAGVAQQTALGAHERIAIIDDFETTLELTVNFKAGSAVLTDEAKAKLDEFAAKTASAKGYAIEICAFASNEGGKFYNHRLSVLRAEVVKDYLIEAGNVAPRRLISPYSGGENKPIADNSTRDGRMQNRRAEVKMLVSKGLTSKESVSASNK